MTKTQTRKVATLAGILVALAVFCFGLAISAYADTRDSRDNRSSGHTVQQPAPAPAPTTPPPAIPPPAPSGGITNVTEGTVDSGGNTGGTVTTGDEHVDVTVVNIGPTNNPPPPPPPAPAPEPTPPAPECDPRDRTCATQDAGRTR